MLMRSGKRDCCDLAVVEKMITPAEVGTVPGLQQEAVLLMASKYIRMCGEKQR